MKIDPRALAARISAELEQLRNLIAEPIDIKWADNISIEVRPRSDDNRIGIFHLLWGNAVVNYTGEGLIAEVFCHNSIEPAATLAIHCNELAGSEG